MTVAGMSGLKNMQFADVQYRMNKLNTFAKSVETKKKNEIQLRESCKEMESLFVSQLLKEMRATIPKSGFIDGGNAEDIYTSMLDEQYAKEIAQNGSLGLAETLYRQLGEKLSETDK